MIQGSSDWADELAAAIGRAATVRGHECAASVAPRLHVLLTPSLAQAQNAY